MSCISVLELLIQHEKTNKAKKLVISSINVEYFSVRKHFGVKLFNFSFNFPGNSVSLFRLSNLIALNDLTPGETYNITIEVVGEGSNPHVRRIADEVPLPPAELVEKSAQRTFESHTLTVHWEKTGFYKVRHFVVTNIS